MTIDECGPKLTSAQIATLETDIEVSLPNDYREFLLNFNGGIPSQENSIVDVVGLPGTPTDVQVFFGIGQDVRSSEITWNITLLKERCSFSGLVPIACDSGGNLFCLRIAEDKSDVVYCDLDDPICPCYLVAKSFNAFLKKLRDFC